MHCIVLILNIIYFLIKWPTSFNPAKEVKQLDSKLTKLIKTVSRETYIILFEQPTNSSNLLSTQSMKYSKALRKKSCFLTHLQKLGESTTKLFQDSCVKATTLLAQCSKIKRLALFACCYALQRIAMRYPLVCVASNSMI